MWRFKINNFYVVESYLLSDMGLREGTAGSMCDYNTRQTLSGNTQ